MWLNGSTLVNSFVDHKGDAWEFSWGFFLVISRTESLENKSVEEQQIAPRIARLIPSARSTRVIPRTASTRSDNLSFTTLFQDTLSCFSRPALAATLENLQIVPHYASGAVLAEGRQRACLSVQCE